MGTAFAKALRRIGCFFYPVRFTSAMPSDISDLWRILRNWVLIPSRGPPLAFDGRLFLVARSISRASWKWFPSRWMTAPVCMFPRMMKIRRRAPQVPMRDAHPVAPSSPARIPAMTPLVFIDTVAYDLANGFPLLGSLGLSELARLSDNAPSP